MTYFKQLEITNPFSDLAGITSYGELRTVEPVRLAGAAFTGIIIDPNFWVAASTGGGSATQANGQQILATGTTANGSASCVSVALARYVSGSQMRYLARAQMGDNGTASNVRRWGPFDGTNGAYFKLSGVALYACTMMAGVETAVPSASWNQSTVVPTLMEANFYEIYYTPETVIFAIDGSAVHVAVFATTPWTAAYHLPIFTDNTNSGGLTANLTITARECAITRLGRFETQPKYFHGTGAAVAVLKYGPGILHKVVINNMSSGLTFYDNTAASGQVIALIGGPNQAGPTTLIYDVPFTIGLTVGKASGWDVTVVYE
jgi:hypothetical protein